MTARGVESGIHHGTGENKFTRVGKDSRKVKVLSTSGVVKNDFGEMNRLAEVADVEGLQSSKKHFRLVCFASRT